MFPSCLVIMVVVVIVVIPAAVFEDESLACNGNAFPVALSLRFSLPLMFFSFLLVLFFSSILHHLFFHSIFLRWDYSLLHGHVYSILFFSFLFCCCTKPAYMEYLLWLSLRRSANPAQPCSCSTLFRES